VTEFRGQIQELKNSWSQAHFTSRLHHHYPMFAKVLTAAQREMEHPSEELSTMAALVCWDSADMPTGTLLPIAGKRHMQSMHMLHDALI
jgi:hypothetical protein